MPLKILRKRTKEVAMTKPEPSNSIKVLSESDLRELLDQDHHESILNLLENSLISTKSQEVLNILQKDVFNIQCPKLFDYLIKANLTKKRLNIISQFVLPYLRKEQAHKKLFYALKVYEGNCLAKNISVWNFNQLKKVIEKSRLPGSITDDLEKFNCENFGPSLIKIPIQNSSFSSLLRLAWDAEETLYNILENNDEIEFQNIVNSCKNNIPACLHATELCFPMGGGESFVNQSCAILSEFAIKNIWLSFSDGEKGEHQKDGVSMTPFFCDVRSAGRCRQEAIERTVDLYRPHFIHSHGTVAKLILEMGEKIKIPSLIGFHFWNGLVTLGDTGNVKILDNIERHSLCQLPKHSPEKITKYLASEFMHDVVKNLGSTDDFIVIHPVSEVSSEERYEVKGDYVLHVNITELKGGEIFFECVRVLGNDIPFAGVITEPNPTGFYEELHEVVKSFPKCELWKYGDIETYFKKARFVIAPSIVDETFCRVAYEASMYGLAVLSTKNGFLKYMFGENNAYLSENPAEWVETIRLLYHDKDKLNEIATAQRKHLQKFSESHAGFLSTSMALFERSSQKNIGIFTVWGDQGLGNLSHTYTKALRQISYNVHIFSFLPYVAEGRALSSQSSPADWSIPQHADSVYYSFNIREEVTLFELKQWISCNNISILIVPEICWWPNWERLFKLQEQVVDLVIYCIPMIEIAIDHEILFHNRLTKTFWCTRIAQRVGDAAGVDNGIFLGNGFESTLTGDRLEKKLANMAIHRNVKFLHVGGHNANTRKNTCKVIRAFEKALEFRNDIELTVTTMVPISGIVVEHLPSSIKIIQDTLSRDQILNLYEDHDVSIQVPTHEGLGLGFFESLSRNCLIITTDVAPNNEFVLDGLSGFLIPASQTAVPDTSNSMIFASTFSEVDLVKKIVSVRLGDILSMCRELHRFYDGRLDMPFLETQLLKVISPRDHSLYFCTDFHLLNIESMPEVGYVAANPTAVNNPTDLSARPATALRKFGGIIYKAVRWALYPSVKWLSSRVARWLRKIIREELLEISHAISNLTEEIDHYNKPHKSSLQRDVEKIRDRLNNNQ